MIALLGFAINVHAQPADMTGLACTRAVAFGIQTWEFFGDVALRYNADGSFRRFHKIGTGAYEGFGKDGEWSSTYLFFKDDDQINVRLIAQPGALKRDQDPLAPLETGVFPLNADCVPIWEKL